MGLKVYLPGFKGLSTRVERFIYLGLKVYLPGLKGLFTWVWVYVNFQSGRRVPSLSLYSSDVSSQYLDTEYLGSCVQRYKTYNLFNISAFLGLKKIFLGALHYVLTSFLIENTLCRCVQLFFYYFIDAFKYWVAGVRVYQVLILQSFFVTFIRLNTRINSF